MTTVKAVSMTRSHKMDAVCCWKRRGIPVGPMISMPETAPRNKAERAIKQTTINHEMSMAIIASRAVMATTRAVYTRTP